MSRAFFKFRHGINTYRWVIVGLSVGIAACFSVVALLRKYKIISSRTAGYLQLDGKDGLLGGSGPNGKVD